MTFTQAYDLGTRLGALLIALIHAAYAVAGILRQRKSAAGGHSAKEPPMPDTTTTTDAVQSTAGANLPDPSAAVAGNGSQVATAVVQTVSTHPDVPASKAANIIVSILSGIVQAEPAIFALSRASTKTQTEFGLGLGLAEILAQAVLTPNG